jgi:hypothetical protein
MDLLKEKLHLRQIAQIYVVNYRTLLRYKRELNVYSRDRSPENS